MDSAGEVIKVRSPNEVAEAIRAFTPVQWLRLRKVSEKYAPIARMKPDDLVQEAFVRALDENGRKCPAHIDVVKFLAEAMRSIADGELEKLENTVVHIAVAPHDDDADEAQSVPDRADTAEQQLMRHEEAALIRRDVLALFDDDPQAHDIVEGVMEGMTADELRELTGLDKTGYDSKRRLIRRRIDKAYPQGWKL